MLSRRLITYTWSMIKVHSLPIFPVRVVICLGSDLAVMEKEISRYIKGYVYQSTNFDGYTDCYDGCAVISIINLEDRVIYHEAAHAAFHVLGQIGEFPSYSNQETFCYLQGFIAGLINEDRRKFKSKTGGSL